MKFHRSLPDLSLAVLLTLFAVGCGGSGGGGGSGGDSEDLTDAGIESLGEATSEGLLEAIELFEEALEADSDNDVARSLLAMCEVLAFLDEPNTSSLLGSACGMDLETLLDRLEIDLGEDTTIFTIIDGTAPEPTMPDGPPSDPPTGTELQSFLRCELIPLLQDTAEKLEDISSGFTHEFEEGLLGSEPFSFDHGDAHLMAAALRGMEMMMHKLCIFELALDPKELLDSEEEFGWGRGGVSFSGSELPTQLFTGDSPSDVVPEQLCDGESGVFNAHLLLDTAGLLDASAEAQTHLDEWVEAAIQLLLNINDAVDGKIVLEEDGAEPGLIEIDSSFICAKDVWVVWLVDLVGALLGLDSTVAAIDVADICGIEIHLPELELPEELFEAETYSNRPFLPTYADGECYDADSTSFGHLSDPAYDNLHALAAVFAEDGTLDGEDMFELWHAMECAFESMIDERSCGLDD